MNTPNGSGNSMGPGASAGGAMGAASEKIDQIKQKAKDLVDQGHEKMDHLKTRAVDVKDQALSKGNVYLDRATDMIRANPIKAVSVAFGVGYIGMRLFRR
ncbi:MAG: hypothetical protein M3680_06735 [Myxococcota bacterium]|nr:hypothetical protein [Myxococcota bacterium]